MKIRTLLVIYAAVSLVVGVGYLFVPEFLLKPFDIEITAVLVYLSRLLGAAMLALAILTWLTRNIGPGEARSSILLALFVFEGLGFVLSLIAQLNGELGALGWGLVGIFLIFAVAMGYARFVKSGVD
jgi:hypothetical protein